MVKKEFENLYVEKLNLKEKNWFLMPERSVLSNNKVIISGHLELDYEYLYFVVKDEVWEMYLESSVRFVEQDFLLPNALFKRCIAFQKDFSYGVDKVQYKPSGKKGQVIVILDHFAKKVVNVLEEKPEVKEKLISGKAGDGLYHDEKTQKIEWKSDATKWGENMISEEEIVEFEKSKSLKISSVPVTSNARTIVPEEMFEKPLEISADCLNMISSYPKISGASTVPEEFWKDFVKSKQLEEVKEDPVLAGSDFNTILENTFDKEEYVDETFKTITENICNLLEYKNNKYGNSALKPLEIFTGKSQVGSRLDDKLARIKNSKVLQKNDLADLIGYCILVCKENNWTTFDEFKD